jgi:hypothetical protein
VSKTKTAVAFIIFRRPKHTALVFDEIRRARPSRLYIIADGARTGNQTDYDLVADTRKIVDSIDWPCVCTQVYSNVNLGLRDRVLSGLDFVFSQEERAIVLEDDCLPSPSFFDFCEELLERFEGFEQVALVSGSNFAPYKDPNADYFFSRSAFIWGWGTWARQWKAFRSSPQVEDWTKADFDNIRDTFSSRVQRREFFSLMRVAKKLNTWDVSWAVWIRQNNLLAAVPRLNLVENIGFGVEATHTRFEAFDVYSQAEQFREPIKHLANVLYDAGKERRMWRAKMRRWVFHPILHPVDFCKRVARFLRNRGLA